MDDMVIGSFQFNVLDCDMLSLSVLLVGAAIVAARKIQIDA
jgi:hypothetical protein